MKFIDKNTNLGGTNGGIEKLTFLPSDLNTLEIIAERLKGDACKRDVGVVLEALKKRARWAMECKQDFYVLVII